MRNPTQAHISSSALRHNVAVLRDAAGGAPLCAVAKADAYGHGAARLAAALRGAAIPFWGVATLPEGLALRQLGVTAPILVFRPLGRYEPERESAETLDALVDADLRATVASAAGADLLARRAARRRRTARVHLKVNTGMNRNGCPAEDALSLARRIAAQPFLECEGVYSHFAAADEPDLGSAHGQLAAFRAIVRELARHGLRPSLCHMANTGAVFNLRAARFDMVRPGIGLYGYGGAAIRGSRRLRPALRLDAPVVLTRRLPAGASCGYGLAFTARRPTRIGLLPIGYADGYDRRLSNGGPASFGRRLLRVIGRVSMDLTMVDLTDAPEAAEGARICLISERRADPHSVESLAARLGTIPHEITCALGPRIDRVPAP